MIDKHLIPPYYLHNLLKKEGFYTFKSKRSKKVICHAGYNQRLEIRFDNTRDGIKTVREGCKQLTRVYILKSSELLGLEYTPHRSKSEFESVKEYMLKEKDNLLKTLKPYISLIVGAFKQTLVNSKVNEDLTHLAIYFYPSSNEKFWSIVIGSKYNQTSLKINDLRYKLHTNPLLVDNEVLIFLTNNSSTHYAMGEFDIRHCEMGIVQYIDNEDLCNDIANSSSSISISLSPKTIQIEALKLEKIVYENASIRQGSKIKNMESTIKELETKIQILISEKETLKQQLKIPSQGEVVTFSPLEAGTHSSNNNDLSGSLGTASTTNGEEGGS
jgi:hypothetical protein